MSNVGIVDQMYGYFNSDNKFFPVGSAAYLKRVEINIIGGKVILYLSIYYMGKERLIPIPREDVYQKSKLIDYASLGFDVTPSTAYYFVESIRLQENLLDLKYVYHVHNQVGWHKCDNKRVFLKQVTKTPEGVSEYIGDLAIKPNGSRKEWLGMMEKYVVPSPELSFLMIAGLSAIVNGYSEKFCNGETLLIHLLGNSSSGKTTAAMLAVSLAGKPSLNESSLFKTWGSTRNAIMASLADNYGLPVVFDELSMFGDSDLTQMVYALTSGRDKARLNKESELAKQKGYRTVVISTGEKGIIDNCNGNNGIKVRVIELNGVQYTPSAEAADEIKEVCGCNYGWIASDFIDEFCLKLDGENRKNFEAKMFNLYDKYCEKFKSACYQDEFTSRMAKKYALLMLTAKLANVLCGLNVNIEALFNFIVRVDEMNNELHSKNIAGEFIEKLVEFISSNHISFIHPKADDINFRKELYGKVTTHEVIIIADMFKQLTKKLGFEDANVVINELKKHDLLRCDTDGHNTLKRVITKGSTGVRCYVVKLPDDSDLSTYEEMTGIIGDHFDGYDDI